jgi:[protein-PII] uridylyltransferase
VGKIEGRGHARKGARLSKKILARMFFPADDIKFVSTLIQHHLLMSHFSQRRDPSDIGTITSFCKSIKDRTMLKHLCLLTYADYKATSPLVWNDWKRTLLWELYVRAYDFMMKKEKQPEVVYQTHKTRLLDSFVEGVDRDAALEHLDFLPGGYLLTMTAAMVREHMRMIATLEEQPFSVHVDLNGSAFQVTFCTNDKPFRLSQLCGILSICDFNILHAYAFTRSDGKVIDVFDVADMTSADDWEQVLERMDRMRGELSKVFEGALDLADATERHAGKWRRRRQKSIPVEVKVQFENDVSNDFTIVDIFAADRPGLLHDITHVLSAQGLLISRAKISTEANRAIDSFYITDGKEKKLTAPSRLEKLRKILVKAAGE